MMDLPISPLMGSRRACSRKVLQKSAFVASEKKRFSYIDKDFQAFYYLNQIGLAILTKSELESSELNILRGQGAKLNSRIAKIAYPALTFSAAGPKLQV